MCECIFTVACNISILILKQINHRIRWRLPERMSWARVPSFTSKFLVSLRCIYEKVNLKLTSFRWDGNPAWSEFKKMKGGFSGQPHTDHFCIFRWQVTIEIVVQFLYFPYFYKSSMENENLLLKCTPSAFFIFHKFKTPMENENLLLRWTPIAIFLITSRYSSDSGWLDGCNKVNVVGCKMLQNP